MSTSRAALGAVAALWFGYAASAWLLPLFALAGAVVPDAGEILMTSIDRDGMMNGFNAVDIVVQFIVYCFLIYFDVLEHQVG